MPLTRIAAGRRLTWLHLVSRRVPTALLILAVCAGFLRVALAAHWITASGPNSRLLPVLIEAAAAAVIAVSTYNPFGEPERTGGRWLPWLRLCTALTLTGLAAAFLGVAAAGASLPDGSAALLRNLAGATGIGLLAAAALGGLLAWIGPVAYTVLAVVAIGGTWTTPLIWPARPGGDRGAALCAVLLFAVGLALAATRGPRD